jgi:sugar lactone lactonase YvrE
MKKTIQIAALLALFASCKEANNKKETLSDIKKDSISKTVTPVASFAGQQVTGVTVTDAGRIFANFPRWRNGVKNSVVEISSTQKSISYPNATWNSWEIGQEVTENKFVGVQSVVAFENKLYILDTRSALFEPVLDAPRIFVFDLTTNLLDRTYLLTTNSYHSDSYINDLRIDKKNQKMYCTDSGHAGLVVVDLKTGTSKRILDNHKSTKAEFNTLTFKGRKWKNTIHSDGIALDTINNRLYYHALTGYSLYSISTNAFNLTDEKAIENEVKFEGKTAAPDGMIFDQEGNLYFADLENNKIQYRKPDGSIKTLIEGDQIKWADTFSIYNGYLYFTNSRINEVTLDISKLSFTVNKIKLPN